MSVSGMMTSLAGFSARMVLIVMSASFLLDTIGWMRLSFSLVSTKPGSNANLVDEKLANSMRFNPFSLSLIMASVLSVALATYSLYVPIFPKKQSDRRLFLISMLAFFSGLIYTTLLSSKLTQFEENKLIDLVLTRPMYQWKNESRPMFASGRQEEPELKKQLTIMWDLVQENLECCGFESPRDWSTFEPHSSKSNNLLPRSCCRDLLTATIQGDGYCRFDLPHWTSGCSEMVVSLIRIVKFEMLSFTCFSMIVGILASIMAICGSPEEPFATQDRMRVVAPPKKVLLC